AASTQTPASFVPTRPLWVAQDGHVSHVAGPEQDLLIFDYPLAGTFEVSFDAFNGPWAEGACAYAGLVVEPFWNAYGSQVFPVGGSETAPISWKLSRPQDFNRITIQVSPEVVRYIVNGHLYHEDKDPSPTSPWMALFSRRERHSDWRNFAIKGSPTIPREVP